MNDIDNRIKIVPHHHLVCVCRFMTWEYPDVPIYVPVTQVARKGIEFDLREAFHHHSIHGTYG